MKFSGNVYVVVGAAIRWDETARPCVADASGARPLDCRNSVQCRLERAAQSTRICTRFSGARVTSTTGRKGAETAQTGSRLGFVRDAGHPVGPVPKGWVPRCKRPYPSPRPTSAVLPGEPDGLGGLVGHARHWHPAPVPLSGDCDLPTEIVVAPTGSFYGRGKLPGRLVDCINNAFIPSVSYRRLNGLD